MDGMIAAGLHFGHQASRWNPRMAPYIYSQAGKNHVFDLEKTAVCLKRAELFVQELAKAQGGLLFVGTRQDIAPIIRESAKYCGQPHVTERWMGGTLTNWKQTESAVDRLAELDKERHVRHDAAWNRDYRRLWRSVNGISSMSKRPDALFISDISVNAVAVKEANKMMIPVIGIVDSNDDPTCVEYPIPANNDSVEAVYFIARVLAKASRQGSIDGIVNY
eukprot:CAMPEP_0113873348 /NCGR_PEP_ID=MMETSP0780_2-20120614/3719_1 /TAXON_ID=652834 /ORGANISM="Palpitomonas bilix" /LENGTH=219 /DNA_ID=CAMNT_0000858981 /DNA_START=104 /DNA_END=763 /DNA_ORIENTATION=- /assembly_acc=CAM_ASM_000599